MELSVSILGIKENLKEKIKELNKLNIDYLHLDIMDGKFVENVNDDYELLEKSLIDNKKKLDIHLMVKDVTDYVQKYKKLNPYLITFHYEVLENIDRIINLIKDNNIKVGISIKPLTDVSLLIPYLDKVDLVLVMTVEPGKGGQKLIEKTLEKIDDLIYLREKNNYHFKIEVDGGINDETIKKTYKSDISVVGSFITSSNNYKERINKLKHE